MTCTACGSLSPHPLVRLSLPLRGRTWRPRVHECAECSHIFLPTSDEEQREIETWYAGGYAGFRVDPVFEAVIRREIRERIVPEVPPPARVLDVGCGNGAFLAAAEEAGYRAEGIDVSRESARLARERGLSAREGDLLTAGLDPPYDVITFWDVVEHLREPCAFLSRARALLRSGGMIVLKIPGYRRRGMYQAAAIPRIAPATLGVPAHVQFFNRRSLEALLKRTEFGRVKWLPSFDFRALPPARSALRGAARSAVRFLGRVGGNGNLYLMAHRE